ILPALFVFLLSGARWQMDAHMYFFTALAALTVLCDWRPLALAGALIAVHHFMLDLILPAWVFEDGQGGIALVLFDARLGTLGVKLAVDIGIFLLSLGSMLVRR
ncbi:hypothetical protein ACTGVI_12460, partial [Streptococcus suis]